jgi:hypothetical protein
MPRWRHCFNDIIRKDVHALRRVLEGSRYLIENYRVRALEAAPAH